jgi:ERCC4-type nuclease
MQMQTNTLINLKALLPAGGSSRGPKTPPRRLVVDVREFMSHLPAVLHQQGMELIPVTLEVLPFSDCKMQLWVDRQLHTL